MKRNTAIAVTAIVAVIAAVAGHYRGQASSPSVPSTASSGVTIPPQAQSKPVYRGAELKKSSTTQGWSAYTNDRDRDSQFSPRSWAWFPASRRA